MNLLVVIYGINLQSMSLIQLASQGQSIFEKKIVFQKSTDPSDKPTVDYCTNNCSKLNAYKRTEEAQAQNYA